MNRKTAFALTAVAGALGTSFAAPASGLTAPGIIRITGRQTISTSVDNGRTGPSPGDMQITRSVLYNTRIRKKPIGHGELVCVSTGDNFRGCTGTFALPAGKIAVSGSLVYRDLYSLAVVGGTGKYNNVKGTLTVTRINPKRLVDLLLFRLVI
jgi:hypothetical protein